MPSHILLKNATIIVPGDTYDDDVVALRGMSLLIRDQIIASVGSTVLPPTPETQILDCTGKIIAPGFIDTHHHVWQTQLKGRHADHTLLEYMPSGNLQQVNYTPEDVFWGQLGGCLEALDAGTTTVVDHAHMNARPLIVTWNGLQATVSSGIRSIFCYTPTTSIIQWKPELMPTDMLDEWVYKQLDDMTGSAPYGGNRVQVGLAFDGFFLSKDIVVDLYERARRSRVKLITTHYVRGYFNDGSLVDLLDNYGLLSSDILLSHATELTPSDIDKLTRYRAAISSTPDTELQMGHGSPVCFRDGCPKISSLGIDCHSNNSSDIGTQMRLALQSERARRNEEIIATGKRPRSLDLSVQDVFHLATIQGARAIKMFDQIGSIEIGKLADLVIYDALSPGMICASEEDPVAAIVMHSSIRDINTVIVNGRICKQNGRLVPVDVKPEFPDVAVAEQRVEWGQVAQQLLLSRQRIEDAIVRTGADDFEHQVPGVMKMFHVDEARFV